MHRRSSIQSQWAVAVVSLTLFLLFIFQAGASAEEDKATTPPELQITKTSVQHRQDMGMLVFDIQVAADHIAPPPAPRGQLDGAPVLAYVFATSLKPSVVGFGEAQGTLALAVTSHPDFDDTPLWDENSDGAYDNDGRVYHAHWVVLVPDQRVAGGLSVLHIRQDGEKAVLPPTHPGMPIYLDSPGFAVRVKRNRLTAMVPAYRIQHRTDFKFDAVTSYLQVNTSDENLPMLGVYKVYHVLSGDLSLPYEVEKK